MCVNVLLQQRRNHSTTTTMTKSQEINMLQEMIVQAREKKAGYLYDALVALSVPFENAVTSDFPGEVPVREMIAHGRELRDEVNKLGKEKFQYENKIKELKQEEKDLNIRIGEAQHGLNKIRETASKLASYCVH